MTNGYIRDIPADVLPVIIAGLVREGVTFDSTPLDTEGKLWNVELTGGF